jgi:hypothetical protein
MVLKKTSKEVELTGKPWMQTEWTGTLLGQSRLEPGCSIGGGGGGGGGGGSQSVSNW